MNTKIKIVKQYAKDMNMEFVNFIPEASLLITSTKFPIMADGVIACVNGHSNIQYSGMKKISEKTLFHVIHIIFEQDESGKIYPNPENQQTFSNTDKVLMEKYVNKSEKEELKKELKKAKLLLKLAKKYEDTDDIQKYEDELLELKEYAKELKQN